MERNKKTKTIIIIVMVFVILAGICATLYPLFASWYADKVRSEIQTEYNAVVSDLDEDKLQKQRQEAQAWNHALFSGQISPIDPEGNGYYDTIKFPNTEIMGYVRIPKIHVELPIYHSIADNYLTKGVGHMPQSSLPVGGINSHSVLAAHSGAETGPMFSDLEKMEKRDLFYIDILGETLTYEVYDIEVVSPHDIDSVQIERGKDLCTLITCVPFGINTDRLLIHGTRVETVLEGEGADMSDPTDINDENTPSIWKQEYYRSVCTGILGFGILLILGFVFIFVRWRYLTTRNNRQKTGDKNEKEV